MTAQIVAKCFGCGWESPSCGSRSQATIWQGIHAAGRCPLSKVRVLETSEVSA